MKDLIVFIIGILLFQFHVEGQEISLTIDSANNVNKLAVNGNNLNPHFSKAQIQKLLGDDYKIIKGTRKYRQSGPSSFNMVYFDNGMSFWGINRHNLYILTLNYGERRQQKMGGEDISVEPFSGNLIINGNLIDSNSYSVDIKCLEKNLNSQGITTIYDTNINALLKCEFFYESNSVTCRCSYSYFFMQFFISNGKMMFISINTDDKMWPRKGRKSILSMPPSQ